MPFRFEDSALPGIVVIEPRVFSDARGFFMETSKRSEFAAGGIDDTFVSGVLVTGAGGFAGSHLVDLLSAAGAEVVAWRRQDVDLLEAAAVTAAIARVRPDAVFHCAASAHVAQSWSETRSTLATNVLGT